MQISKVQIYCRHCARQIYWSYMNERWYHSHSGAHYCIYNDFVGDGACPDRSIGQTHYYADFA